MKNMMLIVPNLCGGGQERIAALTSMVLENDYNIFFVLFDGSEQKYILSSKAELIDLSIPSRAGIFAKIWNVIKRVQRVKQIKKKNNIDISISFGRTANVVNCLSKENDVVISSVRNSSNLEIGKRNLFNHLIYYFSDKITFVSEGQRNRFLLTYPRQRKKSFVVYNPCDVDQIFQKSQETNNFEIKENTIVSAGRLEDVKCHVNLINSINILRKDEMNIHLIIIGEGKKKSELEKLIKDNNMENMVSLIGFHENPFNIISKCKVFAFSSCSEGFPNAIVEALACGVPVVSTDCLYGPREILSTKYKYGELKDYSVEEYGVLTPSFVMNVANQIENEKVFASAIKRILTDAELNRMLQKRAISRSKDFSIEMYRKRLIQVAGGIANV